MSPLANNASINVAPTLVDRPQVSWIIHPFCGMAQDLFAPKCQELVFFELENKKGWAFGPPLG